MDIETDKVIIDKPFNQKFTQLVGVKGILTILIEVGQKLKD
ncbi:hypothetical protein [Fictibacillus nanhaiensis]